MGSWRAVKNAESWRVANAVLRDGISAERWTEDVGRAQKSLGPVTSRKLVVKQRLDAPPGVPAGDCIVRWRCVVDYFVR